MNFISENASLSHNFETYDYVRVNAPILRETFNDKVFTRKDYENRLGRIDYTESNHGLHHEGLCLKSAVQWGFVEIVKEEPIYVSHQIVYQTTSGKRICSAYEYDKMDKDVIDALTHLYGKLVAKLVATPYFGKRYYYKWNEEKYQEWLNESKNVINNKIQERIALKEVEIEVLKNKMI